jgi:hypothetical protein
MLDFWKIYYIIKSKKVQHSENHGPIYSFRNYNYLAAMKMWILTKFFLFTVLFFGSETAYAQRAPVKNDSTIIYKKIENFSSRSKFTRFAYGLIFKSYSVKTRKKKSIQKPYQGFEGKIIRRISIETLDPFGNSISDTVVAPLNFLSKAGNSLHLKTQNLTIRNLLLIRPNQRFDSLLVKESERLVRSRRFIRDVSFFVKASTTRSDS